MAQTIAIERVDHIGIRVRDLERALAFYRALGFTLAHRAVGDDVAIVRNEHGVSLDYYLDEWKNDVFGEHPEGWDKLRAAIAIRRNPK